MFRIFLDFLVILVYFPHDIIPVPGPKAHRKSSKFLQIFTDSHRFPQIPRNFWKSEIQIWISGNFPSLIWTILHRFIHILDDPQSKFKLLGTISTTHEVAQRNFSQANQGAESRGLILENHGRLNCDPNRGGHGNLLEKFWNKSHSRTS